MRFAKELGTYLIVGVNSDRIAGNAALVNEKLRIEGIQSNNWVDESFIIDESVTDIISKIKPDYVVKGKEHEHLFNIEDSVLNSYGGKLVFSSGEVVFSSMDLIHKVIRQNANSNFKLPEDYLARHSLTLNNLKETIHQFTSLKVIVIGDIIIDEYITCDPLGMSQEDPTIVVTPVESKRFLGGAAIVAAHAKGCLLYTSDAADE